MHRSFKQMASHALLASAATAMLLGTLGCNGRVEVAPGSPGSSTTSGAAGAGGAGGAAQLSTAIAILGADIPPEPGNTAGSGAYDPATLQIVLSSVPLDSCGTDYWAWVSSCHLWRVVIPLYSHLQEIGTIDLSQVSAISIVKTKVYGPGPNDCDGLSSGAPGQMDIMSISATEVKLHFSGVQVYGFDQPVSINGDITAVRCSSAK